MSADPSPDVCYRHPNRESWVLCSRCGRTICPECQILTPQGVRCPDCVREAGGSVRWESASGPEARKPAAKTRRPSRQRASASESASPVAGTLGRMLRPGGTTPVLTWGTIALVVALWIVGLVTSDLPTYWLAAAPEFGVQIWRYATSALVYPAVAFLSVLLNSLFLALTAPAVESTLGRGRFLVVFGAAAVVSSAAMVISGTVAYGLIGVLFGMFGAFLIQAWSYPPARTQALIIIGVNVLISLALGPRILPQLIGGLIAGAGALYVLQRYEDRGAAARNTPLLIIGGVAALFVVLAVIRSIAF